MLPRARLRETVRDKGVRVPVGAGDPVDGERDGAAVPSSHPSRNALSASERRGFLMEPEAGLVTAISTDLLDVTRLVRAQLANENTMDVLRGR